MGRVQHPIYTNSGEVKCGTRPEKGINILRRWVNCFSITAAPVNTVTHVSFWWCIYDTTKYRRYVCNATGSELFSVPVYEVPSEPSERSGTPGCFWRKLWSLLMWICVYTYPTSQHSVCQSWCIFQGSQAWSTFHYRFADWWRNIHWLVHYWLGGNGADMHLADKSSLLTEPESEDEHWLTRTRFLSVLLSTISWHFQVHFNGYIYMCYSATMN